MTAATQIAKHLREVHFGVNWTWSNMRDVLNGVTLQQATTQVYGFNTIATLVFHTHYFVSAIIEVLEGRPLTASDKLSFAHPPLTTEADWHAMQAKVWTDAEHLANLIEQLPDAKLYEIFSEEKYGIYYRNLHGMIEHTHYHLGQIALIKKIVQGAEK